MITQALDDGTTIEVTQDGPYRVSGPSRLRNARGEEVPARVTYTLCRCGNSSSKPFCDGTHWAIGFDENRGRQAGVFVPPLGMKRFSLLVGALLIGGADADAGDARGLLARRPARAGDLLPLVHVALKPDALRRFSSARWNGRFAGQRAAVFQCVVRARQLRGSAFTGERFQH